MDCEKNNFDKDHCKKLKHTYPLNCDICQRSERYRFISQDFIDNMARRINTFDDEKLESSLKDCEINKTPTNDQLIFKSNCLASGFEDNEKEDHDEGVRQNDDNQESHDDKNDDKRGFDPANKFNVMSFCGTE